MPRSTKPTSDDRPSDPTVASATASSPAASSPAGTPTKGRPTPTRKEAEAARKQQLKPALTKKEARERQRQAREQSRNAMMAGDERALLPRDQGPVKREVRDWVDGRRSAGELFLPGALLILAMGFVQVPAVRDGSLVLWFILVVGIVIDSFVLVRGLKKHLLTKFKADDIKGVNFYAIMRAVQIRRLRVPKPQAKAGDNRRKAHAAN
jgi:hypothetical protein